MPRLELGTSWSQTGASGNQTTDLMVRLYAEPCGPRLRKALRFVIGELSLLFAEMKSP